MRLHFLKAENFSLITVSSLGIVLRLRSGFHRY